MILEKKFFKANLGVLVLHSLMTVIVFYWARLVNNLRSTLCEALITEASFWLVRIYVLFSDSVFFGYVLGLLGGVKNVGFRIGKYET